MKDKATDPDPPARYRYRKAAFVMLGGNTSDTARYWLQSIVHNQRTIAGRGTVVWRAYKESSPDDPDIHEEDRPRATAAKGKVYVGPYALKFQNADMSSDTYTGNIMNTAHRLAKDCPFILVPE